MGRQGTRLIFARHAFNQVLLAVWGLAAAVCTPWGSPSPLPLSEALSTGWLACLNALLCMICGERMLLWPCECVGRPSLPAKKLRLVGGTPFSPSKRVRSEVLRNGWCLLCSVSRGFRCDRMLFTAGQPVSRSLRSLHDQ